MKVSKYQTSMVWDIVDHMKEKGLDELTAGYLRFVLEDSIIMNIIVDEKLYQTPFKYWLAYKFTLNPESELCLPSNIDTGFCTNILYPEAAYQLDLIEYR